MTTKITHMDGPTLLLKIARAMERGTLPKSLGVTLHPTGHVDLEVGMSRDWADGYVAQERDEHEVLVWLVDNFYFNRVDEVRTGWAWKSRGARARRRHYRDTRIYRYNGNAITLLVHEPHEHGRNRPIRGWVGTVGDGVNKVRKPFWGCGDCSYVFTDTEAESRGLLG